MKILFLSIGTFDSIDQHSIYPDLVRSLVAKGHEAYVVCPCERRYGLPTALTAEGAHILKVRIGNITRCGLLEKGISTLLIEGKFKRAIKKYFKGVTFDLVLYSTPPVTFAKVVRYIKKRDKARSYLLLKDIFPQNAVDLGMLPQKGLLGLIYRYFRHKEKQLYAFSDVIGCMSRANVDYLLAHNPEIAPERVEVCPNSMDVREMSIDAAERYMLREKYGIPQDKTVFLYGGNLGKPQGIPFIEACLRAERDNDRAFFLLVGSGTEYERLAAFFEKEKLPNAKLLGSLPKEEYDRMVGAFDVGLIFLDHRFTIPNFPSRLLSYMQAGIPVLAATDPNTDVGKVIVEGGFGWWCESDDVKGFCAAVNAATSADRAPMGERARQYLIREYTAARSAEIILKHIK